MSVQRTIQFATASYSAFEPLCTFSVLSQREAASGSAVTATISEAITAIEMVSARSANSWDTASRMKTMGRKTMTAVTVDSQQGRPHLFCAGRAWLRRAPGPCSRCCAIASSITMAVSSDLTDAEGEARERDHIERAAERAQHHQRDGQADRDRQPDEQRGAAVAHEIPEHGHRQHDAREQIAGDHVDGLVDEHRRIERLRDRQAELLSARCRAVERSPPSRHSASRERWRRSLS